MIKLALGCGKRNYGLDWKHFDGGNFSHLNGNNITELFYQNESVDLIYACHVLPYFDTEKVISVLNEWKRVLKYNGIMRLAVSDFEIIAKLYTEGKYPLKNFLGPLFGKWKMDNKYIYEKTTYDYISLTELLNSIGMKNIRKWDWRKVEHGKYDDHSQCYLPHMDKENGICLSLNVECNK
jgi:predicted SAM-dependent methyltransferase